MADIRINALATTATTPASDDYLALDGTAQGTRKILATNIANNVTDVILGASGPSVKSTLSARAPRQGLVFDGTAGATVANLPAFGTGDFTVAFFYNANNTSGNHRWLSGAVNSFGFLSLTTGGWQVTKTGVSASSTVGAGTIVAGKTGFVVYTRSGTSGQFYHNGVALGASFTDNSDYSVASTTLGKAGDNTLFFPGYLHGIVYNRALSASEVVALYEAGAPAGADYGPSGSPAGTAITRTLTVGTWTGSVGGSTLTISTSSTGYISGGIVSYGSLPKCKFRVNYDLTINSGPGPTLSDGNVFSSARLTAGTGKTVELTNPNAGNQLLVTNDYAAGNYVLTINSVTVIGLLLAPDAAQAGGGLTWYDTSGNAANITLPASGVSWNVPFGNNIAASGTNQNITLTPSGTGSVLAHDTNAFYRNTNSGSDTATKLKVKTASNAFLAIDGGAATSGVSFGIYNSSSNPVRQSAIVGIASNTTAGSEAGYLSFFTQTGGSSLTERGRFTETGNLLIGTTTDSGNGKIQLATHTTSAGGIGFGTDVSLYRDAAGSLTQYASSGNAQLLLNKAGASILKLLSDGSNNYIAATGGLYIQTNGTTTALTLDSSQNATFAGSGTFNAQVTIQSLGTGTSSQLKLTRNGAGSKYFQIGGSKELIVINDAGSSNLLILEDAGNATFAGNIKTAAPSGGTAATWRLGTVATVSPTSPNRTIEVEIGGTTYYIHAKTTNN